jgi:opacity protein-like surface antigen
VEKGNHNETEIPAEHDFHAVAAYAVSHPPPAARADDQQSFPLLEKLRRCALPARAELLGSLSSSSQGWTLGGGGEWMFAPHWSAFAEYNFMGFGSSNIQNITAGVNYRF